MSHKSVGRGIQAAVRLLMIVGLLFGPWPLAGAPRRAEAAVCGGLPAPVVKATQTISGPETWVNNTVYHITGVVTVAPGATLTIQAGAVLKFERYQDDPPGGYLDVYGTLDLQSTSTLTDTYTSGAVKFTSLSDDNPNFGCDSNGDANGTSPTREDWNGVLLRDGSSLNGFGVMRYASYGLVLYNTAATTYSPTITGWLFDQNYYALTLQIPDSGGGGDIAATVQGNTFYNNYVGVLTVVDYVGATARPNLYNNTFTSQVAFPLLLLGSSYPVYGTGGQANVFTQGGVYNNKYRAIGVGRTFSLTPWAVNGTLPQVVVGDGGPNFPYAVFNNGGNCLHMELQAGTTLTLPAGTVMKFDTGITDAGNRCRFDAFGTLTMPGTVTFTSFRDDSVGGDANGDQTATVPAAGDWGYVALYNSNSTVDAEVLRYSTYGLYVYNLYGGTLTTPLANSTFSANAFAGAILESKNGVVSATVQNNQFLNNLGAGLFMRTWEFPVTAQVTGNTFTNTAYALDSEIHGSGDLGGTFSGNTITSAANGYRNTLLSDSGTPYYGVARPALVNNNFLNSTDFPIYLNGSAFPTYTGNTFSGSRYKAIGLAGNFRGTGLWPLVPGDGGANFAYVVNGVTTILPTSLNTAASSTVTVPAGTAMKFNSNAALVVRGKLLASGTSGNRICFTSFKDDSCGGNTDGNAATPAKSDWDGLYLEDRYYTAPDNWPSLSYIDLRYADNGLVAVESFNDNTSACSTVSQATFSHNRVGLEIYGQLAGGDNACPGVSSSTFSDNDFGVYLTLRQDPLRLTVGGRATGSGNVLSKFVGVVFSNNGYAVQMTAQAGRTGLLLPTFENSTVQNSVNYPVWIAAQAFPTYTNVTFSGNGRQAILIRGTQPSGQPVAIFNHINRNNANASGTLARVSNAAGGELPYVVEGLWIIGGAYGTSDGDCPSGAFDCPGATVSVPASTIFKFANSLSYIEMRGALDLQGVDGQPVLFTSLKNDAVGGDTNADGATTTPARGDWAGVYLESNGVDPNNTVYGLHYAQVSYAQDGVGVYNLGTSNLFPRITNNQFFENVAGVTFFTASTGHVTDRQLPQFYALVQDNVFANNTTHMERKTTPAGAGNVNVTVTGNCFLPTATYGLRNDDASGSTLSANGNWWGGNASPASLGWVNTGATISTWLTSAPAVCAAIVSTVQGVVKDDSGDPKQGVTVELWDANNNVVDTVLTNASGSYSFGGLQGVGTYSLHPSLSGYNFLPASRTVVVPPSVTNMNFTATVGGGGAGLTVYLAVIVR